MSRRASYRQAVEWIAANDSSADLLTDGPEEVAGYISVALVADIFGKDRLDVAKAVQRKARELWA